ncbi:MAG TPA: DUF2147 domain-containing protein [Methylobacterium sp.]|jgi:uncharacterized protein (DUF2147 family)|uniref:DUF2147 domain-containing protein n=1 Tax=Methylorubrum sp. B1-46 TaxID=2897334 RepID=UPI001E28F985|nr:DUF2147 domain-containing protein [Methylorubrum sp. B1-46]UGB28269.1 DUF2147 domain-containing protein [Methylorubrum sp. B1-46]HEV2542980.1 DUF2147 domain-containing protein [Methylobacterium sp.]
MTMPRADRSRHPTMRMAAFGLLLLTSGGSALAQKAPDLSGLWQTETAGSTVRIARCGSGYCGTIAATAGTGVDAQNPDPALRTRKLVGVQIMQAGTPSGAGFEGSLYNPNDGKTYAGSITPKGPDTVEVAGCVLSVLCKRQTWRRIR